MIVILIKIAASLALGVSWFGAVYLFNKICVWLTDYDAKPLGGAVIRHIQQGQRLRRWIYAGL